LSSRHQKGKRREEVKVTCKLLVVLLVIGSILIIIVIVSMSGTDAKSSQLSRSQRGIEVGDRWEDRRIGELKEWLIPLTMDDLLVALHNLKALLHHIHALIYAPAHSEYPSEHLQDNSVGAGGGEGTTTVGSVRRSHNRSRRVVPTYERNLLDALMKHERFDVFEYIMDEIWNIATNPLRSCGFAPYIQCMIEVVAHEKFYKDVAHEPLRPAVPKDPKTHHASVFLIILRRTKK
jgi:hypothetical protein